MKVSRVNFTGYNYPPNFKKVDDFLLRSAQPDKDELKFLKDNEKITDVINYRTLYLPSINFVESAEAKKLNLNYYHIPTISRAPEKDKVVQFLEYMDGVKARDGKCLHHCKAGADRTGLYSLIYKVVNRLDTFDNCAKEMIEMGYHQKLYPDMLNTAKRFLNEIRHV